LLSLLVLSWATANPETAAGTYRGFWRDLQYFARQMIHSNAAAFLPLIDNREVDSREPAADAVLR
jgi:hypothetical protein